LVLDVKTDIFKIPMRHNVIIHSHDLYMTSMLSHSINKKLNAKSQNQSC